MYIYENNKYFSNKVILFNWVLTCLIVLMHAIPNLRFGYEINHDTPFIYFIYIISQLGVPVFFFMSGLLFYRKIIFRDIQNKLKRRVSTLLIPYIVWNAMFVLLFIILSKLPIVGNLLNTSFKSLDFIYVCHLILDSTLTPLWFVKDLIIYTILSPVIYIIIKNRAIGIITLLLSIFLNIIFEFNYDSPLYWMPVYFSGAIYGLYESSYAAKVNSIFKGGAHCLKYCMPMGLVAIMFASYMNFNYVHIMRLFAPLVIWKCADLFFYNYITNIFIPKEWMGYTFFIYCTHYFIILILQKGFAYLVPFPNQITLSILHLLSAFISITMLVIFAKLVAHSKAYKFLTGNRKVAQA